MTKRICNINIKSTPIVTSLFFILFSGYFLSCDFNNSRKFNPENSDPKAIEIADRVMDAMGGKQNWEDTRHISWAFFDSRKHFWDKKTGNVRIESLNDDMIILMNINSGEGKVYKYGEVLSNQDSIAAYLEKGLNFWINDSYWLLMPFKLKDPGVILKYVGEDRVEGKKVNVIQLSFEDVGSTPENKYLVYVDQETNLVSQWSFFRQAEQEEPNFSMSWDNYQKYGNILLASQRGDRSLGNISVYNSLPKEIYDSFEPVSF